MIEKLRVLQQLGDQQNHQVIQEGKSYYLALRDSLIRQYGYFSLVYPLNPFDGPIVALNWDEEWRGSVVDQWEIDSWLGSGIEWVRGNETKPGKAIVRFYRATAEVRAMLCSVESIFGWARPLPEDFAAYDRDGNVLCFSIAHEEMLIKVSR
jgi:hypothetical protein